MRFRITKKLICLLLVIIMCINNIICSVAKDYNIVGHIYKNRSSNELLLINDNIVEFNEIDDLINLYNATVRNNWDKYENNKDSQEIYDDYMDAYENLDALAQSTDSDVQAAMYRAQADAMLINADNNVNDSTINFLNYLIIEKNLYLSTKTFFINYYKAQLNKQIAEENHAEAQRKYDSAKVNYDVGNITRVDYLTSLKSLKDSEINILTTQSLIDNYKRNLLLNVGKNSFDNVVIAEVPMINSDVYNQINIQNDIKLAIDNNYQYEIYKRQVANSKTEEVKKQYQVYVDSAENYIKTDVEKKYSNINDARISLMSYINELDYQKENEKTAKNEYNNGNLSEKEYKSALHEKRVAELEVHIAEYELQIAYQNYYACINGLATAGN